MGCLTDEQLEILSNDIESGLLIIVEKKHYYQQVEKIKELKQDLLEFGRHSEGCSAPYSYPCRCGWDKVKTLKM